MRKLFHAGKNRLNFSRCPHHTQKPVPCLFQQAAQRRKALASLEKAFELDGTDARILMELDQLYKRLNYSAEERLAKLEKYRSLCDERDDLFLERVTLHNILGEYKKAYELIMSRKFHPWKEVKER